jgi:hypothetical protein
MGIRKNRIRAIRLILESFYSGKHPSLNARQGNIVRTVPGLTIDIVPAYTHAQRDLLFKAVVVTSPIRTVGVPSTHRNGVTGVHGMGVLAAITAGFVNDRQSVPGLGRMLTNGLKSMTVATGRFSTITRDTGSTMSASIPAACVHIRFAVNTTD